MNEDYPLKIGEFITLCNGHIYTVQIKERYIKLSLELGVCHLHIVKECIDI